MCSLNIFLCFVCLCVAIIGMHVYICTQYSCTYGWSKSKVVVTPGEKQGGNCPYCFLCSPYKSACFFQDVDDDDDDYEELDARWNA